MHDITLEIVSLNLSWVSFDKKLPASFSLRSAWYLQQRMLCVPIFTEHIDDFWEQAVEVRHALRLVHLWSDQFAFLCSQ